MPNILTPVSLWSNFDSSLATNPEKHFESVYSGVKVERITFDGRQCEDGRVKIAAAFASDTLSPAQETVIIFPDDTETIDLEVLKFFVKRGYSALMVDYRGVWEECEFFTRYPKSIEYANTAKCGRRKDFVDDSADKTCWYEWVGVGLYARKYVAERTGSDKIAVVGLRNGGEIAWKLAVAGKFDCAVPVCAAGWKAYNGVSKFLSEEIKLDDERYRFIAGVDSQGYAPHVNCPILMLCSTNDPDFDSDRAYDTFSRINPKFLNESSIAFTVKSAASVGVDATNDMFLFFDKYLKNRLVFIPKPAAITIEVDGDYDLIARAEFDGEGTLESSKMYFAEDCLDSSMREWCECAEKRRKSVSEREYLLNVFEKTSAVFTLCSSTYANGFTAWSKVTVKKISGKFHNMQSKCRVMYTDNDGTDGFLAADIKKHLVGGVFLTDRAVLPQLVTKAKGIKGLYSECGLSTYRMSNPRFSPTGGNALLLDLYTDTDSVFSLTVKDVNSGGEFVCAVPVVGGVWQSAVLESKQFKNANGVALADFTGEVKFTLICPVKYAVNNITWL